MSWDCPHLKNDECVRVNKVCLPLQKGCVLEGKLQHMDGHLDKREEKDSEKEENQ
ncbi:MAG: hypothetical protein MRK01_08750 [Candidatus Scalindua sp.]|nr:hypothetical protein [Candidatus Scalindua sp.]